jgi:hypothetical protein
MPLTFSHPAIVLPLKKYPWFSMTGLIIGSMIPDFEFFIRMRMYGNAFSHTWLGLFCFDLPLGILAAFIFHNIVRNSLLENLPYVLRSRLHKFTAFNWNKHFRLHWRNVLVSLLLGIISHLFLDNFTHNYGFFVRCLPVLTYALHIAGLNMPVYWFLQYFISAIGLVLISAVMLKLPIDNNVSSKTNWLYWLKVTLIFFLVILIKAYIGFDNTWGQPIAITISAGLLAVIIAPLLERKLYKK